MITKNSIQPDGSMRVISLQSGSNGNCIYVESGGTRLLFDAGISGNQAKERLAKHDIDIHTVDALLISHDHFDHAGNMGVYHRKFHLPVWVTEPTYNAVIRKKLLGRFEKLNHFTSGETFRIRNLTIETIRTPHDAADGVVFIVDDGRVRFGVMTDLGHIFHELGESVKSLDAVLLESNYDPEELKHCDYSDELKARIKGKSGHISNLEAARLIDSARQHRLQWACLGHISQESNHPDLVRETHDRVLGDSFPIHIASRYEVSEAFVI
ncbi:MAG: MBL fold metallo-hydrolase [Planctomycetaceae bacterium]|nr:MBL fold metallo-hydrolase [Planctomycetaceae bacterium]